MQTCIVNALNKFISEIEGSFLNLQLLFLRELSIKIITILVFETHLKAYNLVLLH